MIGDKIEEATNSTRPTSSGLVPKIAASSCRKVLPAVPTFVSRASYQGESRSKSSAFPLLLPQSKSLGGPHVSVAVTQKGYWRSERLYGNTGLLQTPKRGKKSHVWSTQLLMLPVTAQKSPEVIVVSG